MAASQKYADVPKKPSNPSLTFLDFANKEANIHPLFKKLAEEQARSGLDTVPEDKPYKGLFGHREITVENGPGVVAFYGGRQSGAIFSTFFPAVFWDDGDRHYSLEGYFQYQKAKKFGDTESMEKIINTKSPSIQRKLGQKIKGFDEKVWASVRDEVMRTGLRLKFEQNDGLRHRLLMTHKAWLCEATANEKYWACGLNLNDKNLPNKDVWPGKNTLGVMLMQLRDSFHY